MQIEYEYQINMQGLTVTSTGTTSKSLVLLVVSWSATSVVASLNGVLPA